MTAKKPSFNVVGVMAIISDGGAMAIRWQAGSITGLSTDSSRKWLFHILEMIVLIGPLADPAKVTAARMALRRIVVFARGFMANHHQAGIRRPILVEMVCA